MIEQPLASRTIGRVVLHVLAKERSTLAQGRPRTNSGSDTCYQVVALATQGRGSTVIADGMVTLDQASRFMAEYRIEYGLIGGPRPVRDWTQRR